MFPPEFVFVPFPIIFLKSKKKFTDDTTKYVFRTVNTHPSPEVFLRSKPKCFLLFVNTRVKLEDLDMCVGVMKD